MGIIDAIVICFTVLCISLVALCYIFRDYKGDDK